MRKPSRPLWTLPGRRSLPPYSDRRVARDGVSAHPVITSQANPQIKLMRSLGRRRVRQSERAFLVEGRRLVEEAAHHGGAIRSLLVRDDIPDDWVMSLGVDPRQVRRVAREVFDVASDVEHAQGVAAVCDLPESHVTTQELMPADRLVLILDRMRDPGNMGTTLRSAAAAGIRIVLTTHGSVDPMAPKVVRSGMGAHFRLRLGVLSPEGVGALRASDRDIVYSDASAELPYYRYEWRRAQALIVGGETEQISAELEPAVTRRVAIPMQGDVESLNAGVAASVLLFEAQRQGSVQGRIGPDVDKRA